MQQYTTGEMAKLCGVSVRTVQYYDTRGILAPSRLSEGGRRLYTDEDVKRLQAICFLRDAGFPIHGIAQLLSEEDPGQALSGLLDQQKAELEAQLTECEKKLDLVRGISKNLKTTEEFSLESLGDIARILKNREKMKKTRILLFSQGLAFEILEEASLCLGIFGGVWWPFAGCSAAAVPFLLWFLQNYRRQVSYLCPRCHRVFRPKMGEFFLSSHTLSSRKLTCPSCGRKGFCVETCPETPGIPAGTIQK